MIDHLPPKDRARLRKIAAPATTGDRWGSTMVTVALTGEQWTALLARIVHSTPHKGALSKLGEAIYSRAAGDLQIQLVASSDSFKAAQSRPRQHVHNWCPTNDALIDRCSVCGEERA